MAILPRPSSPRAALRDAVQFMRQRRPHQLVFAALAIFFPTMLVFAFLGEFHTTPEWQPPKIVYVEQWSPERTRAEIMKQQARDLPAEKAEKAAIEEAKAAKRAQFQRIEKHMHDFGL